MQSYTLLGTGSHPDAAIVSPFRIAIEIDREGKSGLSYFKKALMKATVHVLSGAYEACVFVYVLEKGSEILYLKDEENEPYFDLDYKLKKLKIKPSAKIIENLEKLGMIVRFVPPRQKK